MWSCGSCELIGQHAFVGMGFSDRGDAFDFNVALQDHFKLITLHHDHVYKDFIPVIDD